MLDAVGMTLWFVLSLVCWLVAYIQIITQGLISLIHIKSVAVIFQIVSWSLIPFLEVLVTLPLLFYNSRVNKDLLAADCAKLAINPDRCWMLYISACLKIISFVLEMKGEDYAVPKMNGQFPIRLFQPPLMANVATVLHVFLLILSFDPLFTFFSLFCFFPLYLLST